MRVSAIRTVDDKGVRWYSADCPECGAYTAAMADPLVIAEFARDHDCSSTS